MYDFFPQQKQAVEETTLLDVTSWILESSLVEDENNAELVLIVFYIL